MSEPQPLREIASLGTVVETGGGMVAVRADLDLSSYPEPGTRVFVGEETVSVPAERFEAAVALLREYVEGGHLVDHRTRERAVAFLSEQPEPGA